MSKSEWYPIPGYPKYQINELGEIKSFAQKVEGKLLTPQLSSNGYLHVGLHKKLYCIHQLMGMVFFNYIPNRLVIMDHKNSIKTDNRKCNLQKISQRDNTHKANRTKSSQFIGVNWYKPLKKWEAKIRIPGMKNQKFLGRFVSEQSAADAYQQALNKLST